MFTRNQIDAMCLVCIFIALICHQISQVEYDSTAGKVFWWIALIALIIGLLLAVMLTYPG